MNLDVKDNHEEAASGAKLVLELCQKVSGKSVFLSDCCDCRMLLNWMCPCIILFELTFWVQLEDAESWELEIESIILQFEKQYRRRLLYNICFY